MVAAGALIEAGELISTTGSREIESELGVAQGFKLKVFLLTFSIKAAPRKPNSITKWGPSVQIDEFMGRYFRSNQYMSLKSRCLKMLTNLCSFVN